MDGYGGAEAGDARSRIGQAARMTEEGAGIDCPFALGNMFRLS